MIDKQLTLALIIVTNETTLRLAYHRVCNIQIIIFCEYKIIQWRRKAKETNKNLKKKTFNIGLVQDLVLLKSSN